MAEMPAHLASLPATMSLWSVLPFALLLGAIATAPLIIPRFWHRFYPWISGLFAVGMALYYLIVLHRPAEMIHAAFEYTSFIALLGSLFLASGGIVLDLRCRATPAANLGLLLAGALLANVIGTTGASLLLIRPYLRLNTGRLRPYHVVFFIFMVANVGGALTPIGDPPLFLGYLEGIPFFRFAALNVAGWTTALIALGIIFWWLDSRNTAIATPDHRFRFHLEGAKGLWALIVIVAAIFLDPGKLAWLPAIEIDLDGHAQRFSFIRELIQLAAGLSAWRLASPHLHRVNSFTFGPIREVAFLFLGIFATMAPALEIIRQNASHGSFSGIPLDATFFYVGTGCLSAVLDNAPTFLAFLSALQGKTGLSTADLAVASDPSIAKDLAACAMGAVFWGAMTYIGNGPNFMVKSICEDAKDQNGGRLVEVPGFFSYIVRYAIPFLLPVLILVWLLWIWA
jgi:Na+/H+ antiporter NhaD/arsenite permease-like protein